MTKRSNNKRRLIQERRTSGPHVREERVETELKGRRKSRVKSTIKKVIQKKLIPRIQRMKRTLSRSNTDEFLLITEI